MDLILSYIVRLMVWLSALVKPLSRLGLCLYDEWQPGKKLKILLVGYNGARNTGADARVVALTRQLEHAFGSDEAELTVMTLDTDKVSGYFSERVRLLRFTTMFFFSLLRATSQTHVAILCEGSTLTPTFAKALCVFYCQAAGAMKRQHKPCIAYGSEVGRLDGWLAQLSRQMCSDTYFIVRTEESLRNLQSLGLRGHVGTDTAWTFVTEEGESWARQQLLAAGWDGHKPLMGVAVINPFCWPVCPSISRWIKAMVTGDRSQQYDKFYFFSDSPERRQKQHCYLTALAEAANRYQREHDAFVVVLGMEQLDDKACRQFDQFIDGPHAVFTSRNYDVFQMTGLVRQLSILVTSRYHAAVLSMERAIPIVAVSMDLRLDSIIKETELQHYLHHVDDEGLGNQISRSLGLAEQHRSAIAQTIQKHVAAYKDKTHEMTNFFKTWLKKRFS